MLAVPKFILGAAISFLALFYWLEFAALASSVPIPIILTYMFRLLPNQDYIVSVMGLYLFVSGGIGVFRKIHMWMHRNPNDNEYAELYFVQPMQMDVSPLPVEIESSLIKKKISLSKIQLYIIVALAFLFFGLLIEGQLTAWYHGYQPWYIALNWMKFFYDQSIPQWLIWAIVPLWTIGVGLISLCIQKKLSISILVPLAIFSGSWILLRSLEIIPVESLHTQGFWLTWLGMIGLLWVYVLQQWFFRSSK